MNSSRTRSAEQDRASGGSGGSGFAPFQVNLEVFSGPFDLLLSLIAKRELDVTEVALAEVTDEFVAHTRTLPEWNLDLASEFLVIAATLLELKAARLLPGTLGEDHESLELLEARDLLFARLLQYRAYRAIAEQLAQRIAAESRSRPRAVPLEPQFAALLPELVWTTTTEQFAQLAAQALATPLAPVIPLAHLHAPAVSVREQAALLLGELRRAGKPVSFRQLVAGAERIIVVARFLALLELYCDRAVALEQAAPLGELLVRAVSGVESAG